MRLLCSFFGSSGAGGDEVRPHPVPPREHASKREPPHPDPPQVCEEREMERRALCLLIKATNSSASSLPQERELTCLAGRGGPGEFAERSIPAVSNDSDHIRPNPTKSSLRDEGDGRRRWTVVSGHGPVWRLCSPVKPSQTGSKMRGVAITITIRWRNALFGRAKSVAPGRGDEPIIQAR
jgi:hypothetical protein